MDFTFKPDGKQTVVTWSMSSCKNFLGKVVCLFMNIDKMAGGVFENGLVQMKSVDEGKKRVLVWGGLFLGDARLRVLLPLRR